MKIVLLVFLAVLATIFISTIIFGRRSNKANQLQPVVSSHRFIARFVLAAMAVFIVMIETTIRMIGGAKWDGLLAIHLIFAFPCLVLLILLNSKLNGLRSKRHGRFAYLASALFAGTVLTGIPMILIRL